MTFNITDHFLVPKHEILPKEAASEILKKYGLNPEKLPQIQSDDPVILEIGAKRGDVLKITRKSHTAGESTYYRIVV